MAGSHVAVASEWAERPRVLPAAGVDRADVSLLEAGAADAGLSGIDCGHEFEFGEEVSTCVCPADGSAQRDAGCRGPLSVGARGPVAVARRDVPRVALCGVGSPGSGDAAMLNFSAARIYLCLDPTDMRKSFDTLAAMVREHLQGDPLSGTWFVLRGKQGRRADVSLLAVRVVTAGCGDTFCELMPEEITSCFRTQPSLSSDNHSIKLRIDLNERISLKMFYEGVPSSNNHFPLRQRRKVGET